MRITSYKLCKRWKRFLAMWEKRRPTWVFFQLRFSDEFYMRFWPRLVVVGMKRQNPYLVGEGGFAWVIKQMMRMWKLNLFLGAKSFVVSCVSWRWRRFSKKCLVGHVGMWNSNAMGNKIAANTAYEDNSVFRTWMSILLSFLIDVW